MHFASTISGLAFSLIPISNEDSDSIS